MRHYLLLFSLFISITCNAEKYYYIIIGSFPSEERAKSFIKESEADNNNLGIIQYRDTTKYRVFYDRYDDANQARQARRSLLNKIEGAWILPVERGLEKINYPNLQAQDSTDNIQQQSSQPKAEEKSPEKPKPSTPDHPIFFVGLGLLGVLVFITVYSLIKRSRKKKPKPQEKNNEPDVIEKPKPQEKNNEPDVIEEPKPQGENNEPDVIEEPEPTGANNESDVTVDLPVARVNYSSDLLDERTDSYPILKMPKTNSVIRTHKYGKTQRRGYKEEDFQKSIQQYVDSSFEISGDIRLTTGVRPYEPDIAIIHKDIRMDIEIDEPYTGITRTPIHCEGDDTVRNTYFTDRGWIVLRFTERQVHTQELECLKQIALVLKSIDPNIPVPDVLSSTVHLNREDTWDIAQAHQWEKEKYRETYLGIDSFGDSPILSTPVVEALDGQEALEESLIEATPLGEVDSSIPVHFNKSNMHERDNRIRFYPEDHIYTIDGVQALAVSTVISKFFPVFDATHWSTIKAPQYMMTPEELKEKWRKDGEEAALKGTFLHKQIENYYLKQAFEKTDEFHLFEQFVHEHSHLQPYRSEWRIFDEWYKIAGTIDLIVRNNNHFEIYDWKRSKKIIDKISGNPITDNPWNQGIGLLKDIPDTDYNHYCLQQSIYRYILETRYGIQVSNMYLVVLHPNYDTYYKVEVPYREDKVKEILNALYDR
ncbi:MAG: SPOR domain-containing protein [Tannerellaceae bacterium]|nr:SPOR domain-containing protein [Tannerellaceae bacterium]